MHLSTGLPRDLKLLLIETGVSLARRGGVFLAVIFRRFQVCFVPECKALPRIGESRDVSGTAFA